MSWRIYYGDGSEVSDLVKPEAAPSLNVQVITQYDEALRQRVTLSGYDYYWFEAGRWFGGDLFGLFDYLQRSGSVKFGRAVTREQYEACMRKAVDEC